MLIVFLRDNMETLEIKNKFISLRSKGLSFDKIAKQLNIAKQTLINWNKDFEEVISNNKALEIEALHEMFFLSREQRIKDFGVLLSNIKKELLNRNLKEVPTDKLLDLFLKFNTQIEKEIVYPKFKTSTEIEEVKEDKKLLKTLDSFSIDREVELLKIG